MVQRNSKYQTNRTISKNKGHTVNKFIRNIKGLNKVETHNTDYFQERKEQAIDYGDGEFEHKYKIYTVNTDYEKIDKKERKKLYRKAHNEDECGINSIEEKSKGESNQKDESEIDVDSYSEHSDNVKMDGVIRKEQRCGALKSKIPHSTFYTLKDKELDPNEDPEEAQRKKDRNDAKLQKRVYEVSGNPNHILNPLEGVSEFSCKKKQLKKFIEKNPDKKNCLFSGDFWMYNETRPWDLDQQLGRSRRKRTEGIEIKGDLGKYKEFCVKK